MNQAGTGTPAARNKRLDRSLSIARALASAPLPVYGTPITSRIAWSVPPSPRPAWRQRNSTSAPVTSGLAARPLDRNARSRSSSSGTGGGSRPTARSEEHTSELQSQSNLVCRLLLEKKKKKPNRGHQRRRPMKRDSRET